VIVGLELRRAGVWRRLGDEQRDAVRANLKAMLLWTFIRVAPSDLRRCISFRPVSSDVNPHDASVERDATAVSEIKEKLRRGEYRLDERAVADAILRRRRELAALHAEADAIPVVEHHAAIDKIEN
jgi:Anti-sigma-28 factor, FlgM